LNYLLRRSTFNEFLLIANPDICDNENAQNYLEAPIDDAFSCENDDHEEYYKREQNEEFFLKMLVYFPNVIQPRVVGLAVLGRIVRVNLDLFFVLKDLIDLKLQENHENEDPLLKLWRILEVLSITHLAVVSCQA
jgi:hypothetical protein